MNPPIDGRPTRIGGSLALLAALVAAMVGVVYSTTGALLGMAGLAALLGGMLLPRPNLMSGGAALLVSGVFVGGLTGGTVFPVAIGTVAAIMSWDLGHNAASHGRQVGRLAETGSAEAAHALGSLLAGLIAIVIGVGVFFAATGGQPATAVALLGIASIVIVLAIR